MGGFKRKLLAVGIACGTLFGVLGEPAGADPLQPAADNSGEFHEVSPVRLLDTRNNIGGRSTALGAGEVHLVTIAGASAQLPATGIDSVVMNVTAVDSTASGFLTVYPSAAARPGVSNLNFATRQTVANQVMVKVGADGKIAIYNAFGTTHVLVDVVGWFGTASAADGGGFVFLPPSRILDTRRDKPIPAGGTLRLTINNATALRARTMVLNVTVSETQNAGFLTTYPGGVAQPQTSTHNFGAGQAVANLVTMPLGSQSDIVFFNGSAGTINLLVDQVGFYEDGTGLGPGGAGLRFVSVSPYRWFDTRSTAPRRQLNDGEAYSVDFPAATSGVPSAAFAVVFNLTAANGTADGFLSLNPGTVRPVSVSALNFRAGQAVPNLVIGELSATDQLVIFNALGRTDVIIDIAGYFI